MSQITDAVVEVMEAKAPLNKDIAAEIAAQFDLKTRSVIAAAVRRQIPYDKVTRTKTGAAVVRKEDLVAQIAAKLEIPVEKLAGLEKANKQALEALLG